MKRIAWFYITLFTFLILGQSALAQSPPTVAASATLPSPSAVQPAPSGPPIRVRVGVYLLNVGRLDIGAGTYTMDFYVSFRCSEDCQPGNFEILNGRATVDKNDDEPRFKVFRVRADLVAHFDLRSFPFDSHRLQIAFEDKVLQDNRLVYEPDPDMTGIHPSAVVVGWNLDKKWKVSIDQDRYDVYGQSYSRATFSIGVNRPKLSAFLKNLTPALIITLSGFLALLMGADKATSRLTLTTSALVGSVLFHINMTSSMPPIGYLTFGDRLMMINYIGLVLVLMVNVKVLALSEAGATTIAGSILDKAKYWFIGLFALIHVVHAWFMS
ncbi:MAG TPA: hypothetical protein PKO07_14340 [Pseudomonadota bacterium]|nr:hypothetical protein [Pseudomonadota bacterium]HNF98899.1 hypothetical protein [Pseudomonadota bacterium]HNN52204.1 hypothetical protein [Pseudomonadota bacterium]